MNRYSRNQKSITVEENKILNKSSVCVIGCGGLGGYVIEFLGRVGIGKITVVDGDVFERTNLNRQILSDESSIGNNKAIKAKERMSKVNSDITVDSISEMLTEDNGRNIIKGHDVVIDALDNIKTRLILQKLCEKEGIPLVHGSVAGWYGQVATILPGDRTLDKIYRRNIDKGIETELGNLSFIVANIASIQSCEAVKVILGKKTILTHKIMMIDLLNMEQQVINLKK